MQYSTLNIKFQKPIILSLGGSIILRKNSRPDTSFLKNFKKWIFFRLRKGERFIIVTGGGPLSRTFIKDAQKMGPVSRDNLDWLGIAVTRVNAYLAKSMFKDKAYKNLIADPRRKVITREPIIFSGGWKPGASTDFVAVKLAETYKTFLVLNLTNIDYVYDKDPRKFPGARLIKRISWVRFRKEIVGTRWIPGANVPFDPRASKLAQRLKMKVVILNGRNLVNLTRFFEGKPFKGTLIE